MPRSLNQVLDRVPAARAWGRTAGALRRGARRLLGVVPVTGRWLLLTGAAAGAYLLFARAHMDVLLWVTSLAGFGLAAFSVVTTLVGALVVWTRWPGPGAPAGERATAAEAGRPWRSGFVGPGLGWIPLLRVGWTWEGPPDNTVRLRSAGFWLHEEVVFAGRYPLTGRKRRVSVEDAFGLARVTWTAEQTHELQVLPAPVPGDLTTLRHRVSGEGVSSPLGQPVGDRVDLRAYQPGDPVRHLLWKVYARNRRLVVRTPERALVPARRTLAYLVRGDGDEASAGLARQALEGGALGTRWRFGADGSPAPVAELRAAVAAIVASAATTAVPGAGLEVFLDGALEDAGQPLVLFGPPTGGPWLGAVLASLRRRRLTATVVVGARRLQPDAPPAAWRRWLLRPPEAAGESWGGLQGLLAQLHGAGQHGLVVDGASGRVFGAAQLVRTGGSP